MAATGRISVFEYDGDRQVALGRVDDAVQPIAAEGEIPRALVETPCDAVDERATDADGAYRRRSEPVAIGAEE